MDKKTKEALSTLQGKKSGVFYDDSNMFYAAKKNDWKVDVIKLKEFLSQYCNLQFFNYYVAVPKKSDPHYKDTKRFLDKLKPHVTLKKKDLRYIKDSEGKTITKKGDIDVEITVDAIEVANSSEIEVFIIVSGDSDFVRLREHLIDKGKLVLFVGYKSNMAWELRTGWHVFLDRLRGEVAL